MGPEPIFSANEVSIQISSGGQVLYDDKTFGGIQSCFTDNVFGSWTKRQGDGSFSSELVDLRFSPDETSLTMTLKPGVKFHNGRKLNARDIEFSLLRGFFQKETPYYASFLKCVVGVTNDLSQPQSKSVQGIQIINNQTLRLNFNARCPEIVNTLSLPFFAPRPVEELKDDFIHFKNLPVGAGPYRVIEEIETGW